MTKKVFALLFVLLLATLSALLVTSFAASSLPLLLTWFDSLQVHQQTWAQRAMWGLLGLSCISAAYAGYCHQKKFRNQDTDLDQWGNAR